MSAASARIALATTPALAARLRRASPARAVRSKTDVAMRSISSYLPADTYN